MAYIGPEPNPGQNREVDNISSGFNGSTTAFTLQVNSQNVSPGSANAIIVSLGGVVQNPGTDYTVAASTITFTTAPASGLSFFGLVLGQGIDAVQPADASVTAAKLASPLDLPDNQKIRFGTGNDLEIFHDGSNSFLKDTGTGVLVVNTNQLHINNAANNENMIKATENGAVEIYHDNTKQCETSANGLAFPSGKGIDFSATADSAGSMTSELFSDYEEGTFTITENGGISLTVYVAEYIRIGRMVHIEVGMNIATNSDGGALQFSGLPYTAKNTGDNTGGLHLVSTNSGRNDLIFVIRGTDDVAVTTNQNLNVSRSAYSNKQLKFSGSYTAA